MMAQRDTSWDSCWVSTVTPSAPPSSVYYETHWNAVLEAPMLRPHYRRAIMHGYDGFSGSESNRRLSKVMKEDIMLVRHAKDIVRQWVRQEASRSPWRMRRY